ncbi:hypothetical protein KK062_13565 [Fulvivirgaceae bacterium PWU5]|uniref:Uncharacterized protein n=1 Tax=Dawidia cretensis TaxID=2782350 RepID=A0AAP2DX67_9BACT|nr:hypothetical protein [Dawidia cretensis]MBT1709265.1 hypothetical protein [Dawidia cretensis]
MFELTGHKVIIQGLHKIVDNRLVLFSDGENDLLYTGTNIYGNRILGSIVFEDDDSRFLRFIHAIVTDQQYHAFLNRQLSLLGLLNGVESFFLVDFNYIGEEIDHALVSLNEIPEGFRPLQNSFCPDFVFEPTFNFAASLKGNESDSHKALPEDINSINTKFSQFLKSSTEFVSELDMERTLYVEALLAGSFQINFRVEVKRISQTSLFGVSSGNIKSFVTDLTKYIFNDLPNEQNDVFKSDTVESQDFKKLQDQLNSLYTERNIVLPQESIEQKLLDLIHYSIEPLKGIDYTKSFNRIEFVNLSEDGNKIPIAMVDENFIPSVEEKLYVLEKEIKADVTVFDEFAQEYNLQVYSFNTQTGKGGAWLKIADEKWERISLHASGKDNYENTPFTKSMDEGTIIVVNGIAKRVNDRYKQITVSFDP